MTNTDGPTFASTIAEKFARPRTPGWRKPLVLVLAGLSAVLTYITIDLARDVGWREAVLIGLTLALIVIGGWTRSTKWSLVALACAVAAGVLGFRFRADKDLDALYAGLGGMTQYGAAGAILLLAAALAVTEIVHARNARRGW